jgi:hypothetical protein
MNRAGQIQLVVLLPDRFALDIGASEFSTIPVCISPLFIASLRLRGSECRKIRLHASDFPTAQERNLWCLSNRTGIHTAAAGAALIGNFEDCAEGTYFVFSPLCGQWQVGWREKHKEG